MVHSETSTGVASRIAEIRNAMDHSNHPALLLVDTISSLASIDYRHQEWGVDVTVFRGRNGFSLAEIPSSRGGVRAALDYLAGTRKTIDK